VSKCVTANIIKGMLVMTSETVNSLHPHYYVYNKHNLFQSYMFRLSFIIIMYEIADYVQVRSRYL